MTSYTCRQSLSLSFSFLAWLLHSSPASLPDRFNHLSYRAYNRTARGGPLFIFPSSCMCPLQKIWQVGPKSSVDVCSDWEVGKKEKPGERYAPYGFPNVSLDSLREVDDILPVVSWRNVSTPRRPLTHANKTVKHMALADYVDANAFVIEIWMSLLNLYSDFSVYTERKNILM